MRPNYLIINKTCIFFLFVVTSLLYAPLSISESFPRAGSTTNSIQTIYIENIDISKLTAYPDFGIDKKSLEQRLKKEKAKFPKSITLEQLKTITDSFTKYYQSNGLKFHSVFLPPQKVSGGNTIQFAMIEATLGDVDVRGSDDSLNVSIESLFSGVVGKTLYQPNIDKIVLALQEQYGLDTFSYYSRGNESGQVRLNIKISKVQSWNVSIGADNFGNESTGQDRVILSSSLHHIISDFDRLSLGLLRTVVDDEKNTFGYLGYVIPVFSLDHEISAQVSNNVFEVGQDFESLGIEGDALISELNYHYTLVRSFEKNHKLGVGLNHKSNDYENAFDDPLLTQDETSKSVNLSWSYQYRPKASSWLYRSNYAVSHGEFDIGLDETKHSFTKYQTSQQLEWALGSANSFLFSNFRWLVKGQYSPEKLSSFDQFSMTGAYAVRDFAPGYFSGDSGFINTIEWWWPNVFSFTGESVRVMPFLYVDAGYGERLDQMSEYDSSVKLAGAGIGLQGIFFKKGIVSVSAGNSLMEEVRDNPSPEEQTFLIRLGYSLP